MQTIVIFITCAKPAEAKKIAFALLKNKLVACVNVVDRVKSFFWWEGKIDQAQEILLIVKSKKSKLTRIIQLVKSLHSYQVPEIITLAVNGGNKAYLEWINAALR